MSESDPNAPAYQGTQPAGADGQPELTSKFGPVLGIALLVLLYVISRYNYLLFHSLAELFSITVAWSLFIIAWNSRQFSDNKAFVFIGIAYLFVASIDLMHTLSYRGMGIVDAARGANPATQLWIAARLMESASLLVFPLLFFKRLHHYVILFGYAGITALVFISVFFWAIFPDCYVEGTGLTLFKKSAEYLISTILLGALLLLHSKRHHLDRVVYRLISASIVLTIFGELAFTVYIGVYDISNLVGHYFKIVSFFLVYLALIRASLKKPYDTLFRELGRSEKKFKSLFDEMSSGVALHEIVCDPAGKPIDYRFVNLNAAFEKLTGLKANDLVGRTVSEVLPDIDNAWIETYGRVALTGQSVQFDSYSKELRRHFDVIAYCPKHGQFVTIINDITDKKTAEAEKDKLIGELRQALGEIHTLRGILPICSICKKIRDDKGYWNQIESYISRHSDVDFSHSICPECAGKHYPDVDFKNG